MSVSQKLYEEACRYLVAGVNSPVRAFKAVGGTPVFISHGKGSKIYEVDGKEYIDYVMSWGPLILGHARTEVIEFVKENIDKGLSFGAPCEMEVNLARKVVEHFPSVEMVRFVNSGTEATMSALRLARAFTGRKLILKFDGCYHGHSDGLLSSAGSGALTFGIPGSPGVPEEIARLTAVLPYNDARALRNYMKDYGKETACVIVEPVAGNMGVVNPEEEFLEALADVNKFGCLLIFDEVITGFRVSIGGAQEVFKINPDITCFGKIIGGGFPVGGYGGRREIMEMVSPLGGVYQAGTLSGNPIAMCAGFKTVSILEKEMPYSSLEEKGRALEEGLVDLIRKFKVEATVNRCGSFLTLFFTGKKVRNLNDAKTSDTKKYARFFHSMLKRGIYLPPSQFEAWFLSTEHTSEDIEKTLKAALESFKEIS